MTAGAWVHVYDLSASTSSGAWLVCANTQPATGNLYIWVRAMPSRAEQAVVRDRYGPVMFIRMERLPTGYPPELSRLIGLPPDRPWWAGVFWRGRYTARAAPRPVFRRRAHVQRLPVRVEVRRPKYNGPVPWKVLKRRLAREWSARNAIA